MRPRVIRRNGTMRHYPAKIDSSCQAISWRLFDAAQAEQRVDQEMSWTGIRNRQS